MQQATRIGWPSGCFYTPPNATCASALDMPRAATAQASAAAAAAGVDGAADFIPGVAASTGASTEDVRYGYGASCAGRDAVSGHSTFACQQLQKWYTPELARAVSRYARDDLTAFGYAEWDGDGEYHPTSAAGAASRSRA